MDQGQPGDPLRRPQRPEREPPSAPDPVTASQPPSSQPSSPNAPAPGGSRRDEPAGRLARLDHPVIAGFDGSLPSRNALAYAAGVCSRLARPLLVVYVCPSGVYCEPLTGQIVGVSRDTEALERWLLSELDQVTGGTGLSDATGSGLEIQVRVRRGNPARELAALASETEADAVVTGAPAHIWHRIAGSVPSWLARHAQCPVIVVP